MPFVARNTRSEYSVTEALSLEVARRAEKGAFLYPVVAALTVIWTPLGETHGAPAAGFVIGLLALGFLRVRLGSVARQTPSVRAHLELRSAVALQAFIWGSLVAASWAWFGLTANTWLCLVLTAGFAAGGTSALGIHPPTHRLFLTALGAPIVVMPILLLHEAWLPLLVCIGLYYAFLLRDGRQHAEAFESLLRTQQALRGARDQARAGDEAKSAFLAMMSHEIRTPMHAVVGTVSLLKGTELTSKQQKHVNNLARAGENLLALINDILDFSRIDARGIALDAEDFELKSALEEVLHMLEPLAQRKALSLSAHFATPSGAWVRGDRRRLQQVFTNLLGNAIKFTERGHVRLDVEAREQGTQLALTAQVVDTGIGIAEEHLHRVFDPFEQGEAGSARKHAGSGLGLAICARLVRAMGGTIAVSSTQGEGTTFHVTLSLPRAEPQKNVSVAPKSVYGPTPPVHALRRKRVLVVDDNPMNRELASEMLQQMGCLVETAESGLCALELFARKPFDVVLMDCQMRELDGYDTTRRLRELGEAGAEVPVIAVTANAFEEDRTRALAAGMVDLLAKPFGYEDLLLMLTTHIGKPPLHDGEDMNDAVVDPEGLYQTAALHVAKTLRVEPSAARVDRIIGAFLSQWPQRAAEFEHALDQRDAEAVREVLHALSGSAPFLGLASLDALLRRMQALAREGELEAVATELPRLAKTLAELSAGRPRPEAVEPPLRAVGDA